MACGQTKNVQYDPSERFLEVAAKPGGISRLNAARTRVRHRICLVNHALFGCTPYDTLRRGPTSTIANVSRRVLDDPRLFETLGAGGVRIIADRRGDPEAPAVVFLHGAGQTRRSWAKAAAAVASRGWQAITIDLRGHGESDWSSDGDYRVVSFASDVCEVLRAAAATGSGRRLAGRIHLDAARGRNFPRHRKSRGAGRHRA